MWKKGEITVFLSLALAVFLMVSEVCLRSAGYAVRRSELEEALELTEYSVLAEYERTLLERFGLFYLDLGYGTGQEDVAYLEQQAVFFMKQNLPAGRLLRLETDAMARATDGRGAGWYEQAVACIRNGTGLEALEEGLGKWQDYGKEAAEKSLEYEEADSRESSRLEELRRQREEEEQEGTPDPTAHTMELRRGSILHLVVQDTEKLSGKKAELSSAPSARSLSTGAGSRGRYPAGAQNDLYFHAYLQKYFTNAVDFLTEEKAVGVWLDYQLEYVIGGKDSDLENLEAVCARLLAVREGMNYACLLSDGGKQAECEALAAALVGVTLIPGLVEAVKQVLMLAWAFAESVLDVRILLNGDRTAFVKTGDNWRLSLTEALELGELSGYDGAEDPEGMDYQEYLEILLLMTGRDEKKMRGLDVLEGVVRETEKRSFRMDLCTDGFRFRTDWVNGQELTAERWFCYEW